MSSRSFFLIALKLLAILLFANMIDRVADAIEILLSYYQHLNLFLFLGISIVALIYLVVIYLLLFKGDFIISKLKLTNDIDEQLSTNNISSQIFNIAIIIIGLYMLLSEIPNFISSFYAYLSQVTVVYDVPPAYNAAVIYSVARVLIGFLLIRYAKFISSNLERLNKK